MQRDRFFVLGLLLLTFICLWPVGSLGFIGYDDLDYVYQNPVVQSGLNYHGVAWAFGGPHAGNWHPVTWLSHMLDCDLFGLDPHAQHQVNLVFHAANTALLFLWLAGVTGARWHSFFVAAFFAVHPLHVQSVAWISERKDVLSGCFFMGILLAYTRYVRRKSTTNYLLVASLLALGLMSKPMLVTVPLVLLLVDFWPLNRLRSAEGKAPDFKALLWEKLPLFALCPASCAVTLWAQKSGGAMDAMEQFPLGDRCAHAAVAYSLYLGKLFYPADLAILYPLSSAGPNLLAAAGSLLLLSGLFLAGVWRRQASPYLLMGWLWFLVMLVPVIGVVQVGLQAMADRYAYLPSIGLFIALVWGVADWAASARNWRLIAAGLGTAAVLICGVDSRYQLGFWRDNITLFEHVVAVSPKDNCLGYFYLGISHAELGELDEAVRCLNLALDANPRFVLAQSRLGNVLLVQQKYAEAQPHLEAVVKSRPDNAVAHVTLGLALAGQEKYAAAQTEFDAARRLSPNDPAIQQVAAGNAAKLPAGKNQP